MLKWKPGAIVIAYVFADFGSSGLLPAMIPSWLIESLLAVVFAWGYIAYGGWRLGAVAWVVAVTVACPIVILAAIGMTANQSLTQSWSFLVKDAHVIAFIGPAIAAMLFVTVRRALVTVKEKHAL